jgi:hypothetical protein
MTWQVDQSRRDMSWAVRLANRGYDATGIFNALSAKPSGRREPGSVKYQRLLDSRGRDAADAYARGTALKAVEFVRANPALKDRPSSFVRIVEIESLAGALPWGQYGGPGVRRALEAVFVVAERVGGVSFGLALREWGELCGTDERMIRAHRHALCDLEWLRRNPGDRPGLTARFSLRPGKHIHSNGRSECAPAGDREWLDHDAFRPDGLGDVGWYVLSVLTQPYALDALAIRTGLDPDDLQVVVGRLDRADLVHVSDGEPIVRAANLKASLDAVAAAMGCAGSLDADKERHARERTAFRGRRDVNVRETVP